MRKLILPVLTGFCLSGLAQESPPSLLSAGGGHAVTATFTIDWALGEAVVETIKTKSNVYTQGFLQPLLLWRLPATVATTAIQLTAFPNPVQRRITLQFSRATTEPLLLWLHNAAGAAVLQTKVPAGSHQFSFNTAGLAQGSYVLSVTNSNHTVSESFNLIKLH